MSLTMQGKILSFPLREYAKEKGYEISPRAISAVKLLWVSLANFYNDRTHQCNPSIRTLSSYIEKSESQTTLHMNTLKKLGLVAATRNAKGGRYTPSYAISVPSYPVDKGANTLDDNAPQIISHTVDANERTYQPDGSPLLGRTRNLIESLDISLIHHLKNEKNSTHKQDELKRLGLKYRYDLKPNTPSRELEDWLVSQSNHVSP